ncbi:MAG: hypothetical protein ACEPO8_08145 [Rhodothermaceae bacterium]
MKKSFLVLFSLLLVLVSCKTEIKKYSNGKEVLEAMNKKYAGKWYKNFTFSQGVEQFKNDSLVNKEIWHEAYKAPSKLIIKFRSYTSGNGYIFEGDSLHIFAHHTLAASRSHVNFLLTLGFDVYNQPLETTYNTLGKVNFDLEKVTTAVFNGKDIYVVGINDIQEKSNHFYVDAEKLVFLKAVTFTAHNKREVEFKNYKTVDGNYVATEVDFYTNGSLEMTEKYYNMNFPEEIPDSLFDKTKFIEARW